MTFETKKKETKAIIYQLLLGEENYITETNYPESTTHSQAYFSLCTKHLIRWFKEIKTSHLKFRWNRDPLQLSQVTSSLIHPPVAWCYNQGYVSTLSQVPAPIGCLLWCLCCLKVSTAGVFIQYLVSSPWCCCTVVKILRVRSSERKWGHLGVLEIGCLAASFIPY